MVSTRPHAEAQLPEERDGFKFRSGRPALDFLATLAGRRRPEPKELLLEPRDLDRWLLAARLAKTPPRAGAAELEAARELREAIHRLALARLDAKPFPARDRALLNRWAAEPPPAPQLGPSGLSWTSGGASALLAALARDAVELLGGPAAERLRRCEGPTCAILFVDGSRSGRRRWCSMAACGNKEKVGAFRQRQKG